MYALFYKGKLVRSSEIIAVKPKTNPNIVVTAKPIIKGLLRKAVISQSQSSVLVFRNFEWKPTRAICDMDFSLEQKHIKLPIGDVVIHTREAISDVTLSEDAVFKVFINHLTSDPDVGFIDLGVLKPEYALAAAKYGREVTVMTQSNINAAQLCKSAFQNNFSNRFLIFYAVKDVNENGEEARKIETKSVDKGDYSMMVSRMAELVLFVNSSKVIVKIDVEGQEYQVLHNMEILFQEIKANVVIMKWDNVRTTESTSSLIELFLGNIMKPFTVYSKHDSHIPEKTGLNLNEYKTWPAYVQWIKSF